MSEQRHSAENDAKPTLYSLILAGLIEWAGGTADLDDCRSVARHLTPLVRAHIERERAALEARILAGPSCSTPDRDHDGCYVKDALLAVRSTSVTPPADPTPPTEDRS